MTTLFYRDKAVEYAKEKHKDHELRMAAYEGYLAGFRSVAQWIPVEQRMPEDYFNVLLLHKERGVIMGSRILGSRTEFIDTAYNRIPRNDITHWLEIPHRPEFD